jgi:hypothetical protein
LNKYDGHEDDEAIHLATRHFAVPSFAYSCPACYSTNSIHAIDCRFEGTPWAEIETAYTDIIIVLSRAPQSQESLADAIPHTWGDLHRQALQRLRREERLAERNGILRLRTTAEFTEYVSKPSREPMRTIYTQGSVPGCHDNAVFALIAWYEMVGLPWDETKENVIQWLTDSGTWARGGFEESSPAELVNNKQHVYDAGYGWREKAESAKRIIERHHTTG